MDNLEQTTSMMTHQSIPRILAVGSLPPPLGGTSVSFQVFCDEVKRQPEQVEIDVIDAAPKHIKEDARVLTFTNINQASGILWRVVQRLRTADLVLVVGSHQFLLTMGSIILFLAKLAGKPCYFRSFGYLDNYYDKLSPRLRWLFDLTMRHLQGLFVETQLVQNKLTSIFGDKVFYVPGYRHMSAAQNGFPGAQKNPNDNCLRLVFLSQVREEKGIFVLLESLRTPAIQGNASIHCDIYGPIFPSIAERFETEVNRTANATYKGVVKPEEAVTTLAPYDALVFPTFWPGEGHSGVLMEAMMAGIAVITTRHRSIPELVQHEVNGLLAQPGEVASLTEMICLLDSDRQLLEDLALRNWETRIRHSATTVVREMLQLMNIELSCLEEDEEVEIMEKKQ